MIKETVLTPRNGGNFSFPADYFLDGNVHLKLSVSLVNTLTHSSLFYGTF